MKEEHGCTIKNVLFNGQGPFFAVLNCGNTRSSMVENIMRNSFKHVACFILKTTH